MALLTHYLSPLSLHCVQITDTCFVTMSLPLPSSTEISIRPGFDVSSRVISTLIVGPALSSTFFVVLSARQFRNAPLASTLRGILPTSSLTATQPVSYCFISTGFGFSSFLSERSG